MRYPMYFGHGLLGASTDTWSPDGFHASVLLSLSVSGDLL